MKRNLKRILALSILLIMLSLATISMASDAVPTSDDNTTPNVVTSTDDNNTTPTENTYELIASDIYKAEANVIIDQTIDGNVFAFGNNITISVRDYGPGIPESVKNKLFKEMITTKGKEGTGLGVFMSYSMIKAKFNGDMKFKTSNEGTEFIIYLPIKN